MGTIDVLQTFAKRLNLGKKMGCNKIIMIKNNLLTIENVI